MTGPEIGAAYANVDDVANALACVAFPCPAANLRGKFRHLVEHRVNLGNYVRAIDEYLLAWRERAMRHAERRAAR